MSLRQDKVLTPREQAYDRALTCRLNAIYYQLLYKQQSRLTFVVPFIPCVFAILGRWTGFFSAEATAMFFGASITLYMFTPVRLDIPKVLHLLYNARAMQMTMLYLKGDELSSEVLEHEIRAIDQLEQVETMCHPNPSQKRIALAEEILYKEIGASKDPRLLQF